MLPDLISGLCDYLDIPLVEANSRGLYEFVFDGGLFVEVLSLSRSQFLIRSELAQLPEDGREQQSMLEKFLRHNLLLLREQANSVSLEESTGKIWLYRMGNTGRVDIPQYCEMLSEFLVALEWWQGRNAADSDLPTAIDLMPHQFIRP